MALLCVMATACTASGGGPAAHPSPFGEPSVDESVVEQHAQQFTGGKNSRPAGSQEEFAAAAYITGHLQKAGYIIRLDPVPVSDTVRSTNVIALPPSGAEPKVVVITGYTRGTAVWLGDGPSIGLFLELARALNVADPKHSVEFVALGGEGADAPGTYLGSLRLVESMVEDDIHPKVIELWHVEPGADAWYAKGPDAEELLSLAPAGKPTNVGGRTPKDPYDEAGFDHDMVFGSLAGAATAVLDYLEREGR